MDYFLSLNPGLHSRFPLVVDFPDYTIDQLMEIADRMLQEREYLMNQDAERKLKEHLIILRSFRGLFHFLTDVISAMYLKRRLGRRRCGFYWRIRLKKPIY